MARFRSAGRDLCLLALASSLTAGCATFVVSDDDDGEAPGGDEADASQPDGPADGSPGEPGVVEVLWTWTGGEYWNVDQALRIAQAGGSAHWGQHFSWTDEPDLEGGWIAIETDIDRIDGSHGDTAVFVVRDAIAASGPSCAEGASGWRCEIPVELDPDIYYRLRIWTLGEDAQKHTWGAWFMDHATAEASEVQIGRIDAAPTHDSIHTPQDRIELLTPDPACTHAPMAVGYLLNAGANKRAEGGYEHLSIYKGKTVSAGCTGALVEEIDGEEGPGVVVSYGVP